MENEITKEILLKKGLSRSSKKIIVLSLSTLFATILIFGGVIFAQASTFRKNADIAFANKNFEEAADLYEKSFNKLALRSVKTKLDQAKVFESYSDQIKLADEKITQENWNECVTILNTINSDYPDYSTVAEKTKTCTDNQASLDELNKKIADEAAAKTVADAKAADDAAKAKAAADAKAAPKTGTNIGLPNTTKQDSVATYDSTPVDIVIDGSSDCVTKTYQALNLLKSKDIDHYNLVMTYIGKITCTTSGSGTGMYAWEKPPRYQIGMTSVNAGIPWYASTIVHDAWHSKLYNDYMATADPSVVYAPNDVWTGETAELACLEVQYESLSAIGGSQAELDWLKEVAKTKYWEVPPDQRWW
jgi:hypothetical protein